jgi:3-oxoacyl-[acyl-carrier protein] reductase
MSEDRASQRPVAVVTGSSRGIGRAIALELAGIGFDLALPMLDTGEADAISVEQAVRERGAAVLLLEGNLAEVKSHSTTTEAIAAHFGRLDVLVNNAGVGAVVRGDFLDLTPENYDAVVDVNLRGTLFFTQACLRVMLRLGDKGSPRAIVTISSASAGLASPDRIDYCVSKAGLSMAMRGLTLRLAEEGIAVFEVRPGVIRTAMTAPVASKYDQRIADGLVPAGRWGEPEDVAAAVAGLLSGRFGFATGSIIAVDGGLTVPRL